MSISVTYRNLPLFCVFIVSINLAFSADDVNSMTLETGSPAEIAVQQKKLISRTPVSVVAPPEISRALLERSASSQIANQPDKTGQFPIDGNGTVALLADGFEAVFPGAWQVFDNDGNTNGEVYWDQTSFRSLGGTNSAWCAGGGSNAVADGSPYANNMKSWMIAGPFDLTETSAGFWQFNYWLKSESGNDNFLFLVSLDGSNFTGYQDSGDSLGWLSGGIDFVNDPVIGNITGNASVSVAFVFQSNANTTDEGVYVDEVVIQKETSGNEPEYSSTPPPGATLAFGNVVIATGSSPQVVDVENPGGVDLTLSCSITGANADQFDIAACPSPVVPAGATEISVTCDPMSVGSKQATLEVSTNDADEGEVSYTLTCNGIEPSDEGVIFSDGFEGGSLPVAPDLVVINPGVDNAALTPDQPFTIDATALNQGDDPADASTLRYFFSVDSIIASDDLELGTDVIPSLSPASSSAQDLFTAAPEADGTYWVGACVDVVTGETNISNQCSAAVQITVLTLTGTAVASFSPSAYTTEQPVAVSITVTPDTGVSSHQVEDTVPVNWAVSAISNAGVFHEGDNAVKWGPFLDDSVRVLSYTVTPPVSSSGFKVFTGQASFDGTVVAITGERQINEASPSTDSDGDRLPDSVETNTGVFIDSNNTGTNPNIADTDGDGISDGDEVLGSLAGLDLPAMGVSPLRKDLLLEYDWFDDAIDCGSHSHRPNAAIIASVTTAFDISPEPNPDGTNGVNLINDYGQGGAFTGGNFINDVDGVIAGGVSGSDFLGYKAANFAANRNGYFHYVLLPHRYNTNSGSSGQAEVQGDDLIVSLYCANSNTNVANTIMHEVGHNLNLRHGGDNNCNFKPNYNSVMNYKYQFPGVDNNCTPPPDGVLDYSIGDRINLNENNLNENNGTCGPGNPFDWNGNATMESSIAFDINSSDGNQNSACGGTLTTLQDSDDWGRLNFLGIGDADGQMAIPVEIITEQPVPAEYLNRKD